MLVEKDSLGMATTAASSHLIHGGLRYLMYDRLTTQTTCWDSGNILKIAAPRLSRLPILWPVYKGHAHGIESVETLLEVYDHFQPMKGGLSHLRLSKKETLSLIPGLKQDGLIAAISFDEWWVDPVGLVQDNILSAQKHGATIRTGESVEEIISSHNRVLGVKVGDSEIRSKIVINAAGPWVDKIARLAGTQIPLRLQKGTHLVYKKNPCPLGLILETPDQRYIFVIPSPQGTLVGPTDIATDEDPGNIRASNEEIQYLLRSVTNYLPNFPQNYDSTIVGARPILAQKGNEKLLSRGFEVLDHAQRDGIEGLITIGGGKMSDFRLMAEETANLACVKLGIHSPCRTSLETLTGETLTASIFPRPTSMIEGFLKSHPRLRELHAWIYLSFAFLRHLTFSRKKPTPFYSHYFK